MTRTEKAKIYALLRELVILRDGPFCLRCKRADRLQLSHIYPKGQHRKMEFDPDNVKLLCVGCHLYWWHKNPVEAWQWLEQTIERKRIDRLRLMAATVDKRPFDPKLHLLFLEAEIKKYETNTRVHR